ncbi:hypothetical protein LINPERPRIM_LOCUS2038 [Linum perenne]
MGTNSATMKSTEETTWSRSTTQSTASPQTARSWSTRTRRLIRFPKCTRTCVQWQRTCGCR